MFFEIMMLSDEPIPPGLVRGLDQFDGDFISGEFFKDLTDDLPGSRSWPGLGLMSHPPRMAARKGFVQPSFPSLFSASDYASSCRSLDTNTLLLTEPSNALFAPYTGKEWRMYYKCPEDNYLSEAQREAGWKYSTRSVAMNYYLGQGWDKHGWSSGGITGGPKDGSTLGAIYRQLSDLNMPPGHTWVFLDEHPDSIEGAIFYLHFVRPSVGSLLDRNWIDLPASYHNRGCTFAFADGHTEYKKWLAETTIRKVQYQYWNQTLIKKPSSGGTRDIA